VSFGNPYRALWRAKFAVLAGTALVVVLTGFLTLQQTKRYEAAALVRVQPAAGDSGPNERLEASSRLARIYVEITEQGALEAGVQRRLGEALSPPRLSDGELGARQDKDLDLLYFTGTSTSARRAQLIANAAAAALNAFVARSGSTGERVVPVLAAELPDEPSAPNLILNLAFAVLAGLLFNGGLALAYEALRDRLPDPDELERELDLPVLAVLPTLHFDPSPPARRALGRPQRYLPDRELERSG
jgi:capsular polysaccharide biosynthesis protein